jgi:hypothetical protein
MGNIIIQRTAIPLLHWEIIFRFLPIGRQFQKNLAILHGLTRSVIRTRKQELLVKSKHQSGEEENEELGKDE